MPRRRVASRCLTRVAIQMQRILSEQVTQAPIYHLGFPTGVGPRVDDIMATAIPGFCLSPYEDLKLKRQ